MEGVIEAAGATSIGQRSHNEDSWYLNAELGLMLVADGVGGHLAGDVASALTCEVISRNIVAGESLQQSIRSANSAVLSAVKQESGRKGMASTVVAARFQGPEYSLAWTGDSRAYLWDGQLKLLTRDHSYVQTLVEQGAISVEQARHHPRKNVIIHAIGMHKDDKLRVDENRGRLAAGELLLLCSDGLWEVVDTPAIADLLAGCGGLQAGVDALVAAAVAAGGQDNITAVLIGCNGEAGGQPGEQAQYFWSFDPLSGAYSGLPDLKPAATIVGPGSGPIAPQSGDTASQTHANRAAAVGPLPPGEKPGHGSRRRLAFWLLLAAAVAASVLYSLGLEGTG